MAVKLRLQRTGRRNFTKWRVVATDAHCPRDGKCLEVLGWHDSHRKDESEKVNLDRVDYWLSVGAQPSLVVKQIIKRARTRQS